MIWERKTASVNVLSAFATHPKAIRMVPVVKALSADSLFDSRLCVAAQHRQMLDQVLDIFALRPDFDPDLMKSIQDLGDITCNVLLGMRKVFTQCMPDIILVHGDTTTKLAARLSACFARIKVGHVEAGLRSDNKYSPGPQEINRRLTGAIADIHLVPTARARSNLLREGTADRLIHVTGNTVIDALLDVVGRVRGDATVRTRDAALFDFLGATKRRILVTGHRRANVGTGFERICCALRDIASRGYVQVVYPVHLNPYPYTQLEELAVSSRFSGEGGRMGWAAEDLKEMDLGDRRLNKRAIALLDTLAAKQTMSLPSACSGRSETIAGYRLLANDEVTWEGLLGPHWACSRTRIACHPVVLMLQGTSELDFNGQRIDGLGPLSDEAQRGLYVNPTYAVSADREPLGVLDAWMWAREPKDAQGQRLGIKESRRWVEGHERVAELAAELPDTRLVYVADRVSDMIERMARAGELDTPADWLLRARHDRALPDGQKLWQTVTSGEALGGISFTLPARAGQKARGVRQRIWARVVDLPHGQSKTIRATCIVALEIDPPAGSTAVEWRLLTNRSAETLAEVAELIDWYRASWEIEILVHILKNGCRIESPQLRTIDGLQRAIAPYRIVSWRTSMLMRLGRTCRDLPANLIFDQDEWRAAHLLNKKKPPADPTLSIRSCDWWPCSAASWRAKVTASRASRRSGSGCSASSTASSVSSSSVRPLRGEMCNKNMGQPVARRRVGLRGHGSCPQLLRRRPGGCAHPGNCAIRELLIGRKWSIPSP